LTCSSKCATLPRMGQTIKLTVTSEDLLTVAQASEVLSVHLATAYRWVEKGKLHAFRIGGQVFVTVDEVEALKMEKNEQAAYGN
jgi:excisionase family DNA binding protein